jgi:hypothetical protein
MSGGGMGGASVAPPPTSTPGMALPPMPGANFSPVPLRPGSFPMAPPAAPPMMPPSPPPAPGPLVSGGPNPLAGMPKPSLAESFMGPQGASAPPLDANRLPETGVTPDDQKPMLGSSGFIGYKSPEQGGRSGMAEDRIEQQANDLMARIRQAQSAAKWDSVASLKQQLRDLVKQQQ